MKLPASACCLVLLGCAVATAHADQVDAAIVAAMKLSEASNYGWISSTIRDARSAEMRGETNSAGYSLVKFVGYSPPTSSSGGRSLHSDMPGDSFNAVFLGDTKYVLQTDSGWINPDNAPESSTNTGKASRSASGTGGNGSSRMGGSSTSGGGLGGSSGGIGRRGGRSSRSSSGGGSSGDDSGSGAPARFPAGLNLPHEELAIIVANYTEMHFEGDVVTGTLTQIGTELLLIPPGSNDAPPEGVAGTFRLWLNDGVVTKYELTLTAKTAPGGRAVRGGFSETTTVVLKDVGSTKFDIPEAAKKRLTG